MNYETSAGKTDIDRRYDPEHDLPSGGQPDVSWAEYDLQQQIHRLNERVETLEKRLHEVEFGGPRIGTQPAGTRLKDWNDLSQEERDAIRRDPENAI